ncbi:Protein CsaA [Chlamydiales bacterium STE3]|nr:Protein CsaA [Chlamydiales bacterium STE3]
MLSKFSDKFTQKRSNFSSKASYAGGLLMNGFSESMELIEWKDFEKVHLVVATIRKVEPFPEAKKPAYKLYVDCGEEIGVKPSSAQITALYSKEELIGKQVLCVVNFKPKKIGSFVSEILVTGFILGNDVILATPDTSVPNGLRLA